MIDRKSISYGKPGFVTAALQEAFLTKTYEEWEMILLPAGIPMGAINTLDQVVAHASPLLDLADAAARVFVERDIELGDETQTGIC